LSVIAEFQKWLDEMQSELTRTHDLLIMDDAPKNKFSINTGKRLFIEESRNKIESLILEDSARTNP